MSSGTQPSRALLIAAGALTQATGALCLVLALASLPVAHDLRSGTGGVIASIVAALAAIVCGTLVWRGRLVPLALAMGLDIGFGIALPRGGSAVGGILRMLPASELDTADTLLTLVAIVMFVAAVLCIVAVPSALKLRAWARAELASDDIPTTEHAPVSRPSGQTLRGIGTIKLMPTQVIRVDRSPRRTPLLIAGVAVTLVAIGVLVISAATDGSGAPAGGLAAAGSTVGSARGDAGAVAMSSTVIGEDAGAVAVETETVDGFVVRFHAALAKGTAADIGPLFDAGAFAFGVEAHDLAEGRDAIVVQLRDDLGEPPAKGFEVRTRFSHVAAEGDMGWLAEALEIGEKSFVVTAVLARRDGAWAIEALHWAHPMPNEAAYKLAREGELAIPDAIPDAHEESPLASAMRTGFASRPAFVEARSTRAEAINFGSASGERLVGGEMIKKVFGRLDATIHLRDAIKVGAIGDRAGWGIANVDFTDKDKDGTEVTQTFRVLAAWIKEEAGWRIVQTQWSNPR